MKYIFIFMLCVLIYPSASKATNIEVPFKKALEVCLLKMSEQTFDEIITLKKNLKSDGHELFLTLGSKNGRQLCQFYKLGMGEEQSVVVFEQVLKGFFGSNIYEEPSKLGGIIRNWRAEFDGRQYNFAVLEFTQYPDDMRASHMIVFTDQ